MKLDNFSSHVLIFHFGLFINFVLIVSVSLIELFLYNVLMFLPSLMHNNEFTF